MSLIPLTVGSCDVVRMGELIAEALVEAHDDLAAAQLVSHQPGNGVYAQIWRTLPRVVAIKLASCFHVELVKTGRAAYQLPVVEDALVFPWRPAGGHKPADVRFGTSPARSGLWTLPIVQDAFDFAAQPGIAAEQEDTDAPGCADVVEVVAEATRRNLRVIIVAMTADADRLRRIEWGQATLRGDQTLGWVSHAVLRDEASDSMPSSTSVATFADGTPPPTGLRLKAPMGEIGD